MMYYMYGIMARTDTCTYSYKHVTFLIIFNLLVAGRTFNVEPIDRHRRLTVLNLTFCPPRRHKGLLQPSGQSIKGFVHPTVSSTPAPPSFLGYTLFPHLMVSPSFCPISIFFPLQNNLSLFSNYPPTNLL